MFLLYDFLRNRRSLEDISSAERLTYLQETLDVLKLDKGNAYGYCYVPPSPSEPVPDFMTPERQAERAREQNTLRFDVFPAAQVYVMGQEGEDKGNATPRLMTIDCCVPVLCFDRRLDPLEFMSRKLRGKQLQPVCEIGNHYRNVLGFCHPDNVVKGKFMQFRRYLSGLRYLTEEEAQEAAEKWREQPPSEKDCRKKIGDLVQNQMRIILGHHLENNRDITPNLIQQIAGPSVRHIAEIEKAAENWLADEYTSEWIEPEGTNLLDQLVMKAYDQGRKIDFGKAGLV